MPFQFGGPDFPLSLKFARSLMFAQVVLFVFIAGLFFLVQIINSSNTAGTGPSVSTSTSPVLAIVFLVLAGVFSYLAVDLRNHQAMTRYIITGLEIAVWVVSMIQTFSNGATSDPVSTVFSLLLVTGLTGGTVYCLFTPAANAAFSATAPAGSAASVTATSATSPVTQTTATNVTPKPKSKPATSKTTSTKKPRAKAAEATAEAETDTTDASV